MMNYTGDWCRELPGISAVGESLAAILSRCKELPFESNANEFYPQGGSSCH